MAHKCGQCNKNRHYNCSGGDCRCTCPYNTGVKQIERQYNELTTDTKASKEMDKIVEDANKKWRAMRATEEKKFDEAKARIEKMNEL